MKKILLIAAAFLGMATAASAQTFENGSNVLTATVGCGVHGLPVTLTYERGVYEFAADHALGVGASLGFVSHDKSDYVLANALCNYHYTGVTNFDFYGGLRAGYIGHESPFYLDFSAGARYYFNDSFAINADLGAGVSYLNVGVSYKF